MNKLIDFPYSHVLVLGLAKSGTAAAKVFLANEKNVRVNDMQAVEEDEVVKELKALGASVILGEHPISVLDEIEIIVKNPGIPYSNPILEEAMERNIPIITEIELAGQLTEGPVIGITGSNGKTTTTILTAQMIEKSNLPVKAAGNIGHVATEVAQTVKEAETMVLELSSFQLLGIEKFRPKVAVLLNIFEAHLDYHKTMDSYKKAKFNIFKNQESDDYLVYNADDPAITAAIPEASSQKVPFSIHRQLDNGVWLSGESIYFKNEIVIDRKDIVLVGEHNLENILASIAAAKLCGATNKGIGEVLKTFSGVKHRLQFVDNINDRLFYNDSKATNLLATEKALTSFQQPTILLAGGLDRGNEFNDLLPFLENVKAMVLFGETREKLKKTAENAGIETIILAETMQEAVHEAYAVSDRNDVILLSPACASWDQYRTFEERGDMFIQAVHTLV
ncbi:UDP-N-acetylmuramoyl-L-alanine--D-glutamate ligase [Virgibacillus indicus]|uniref:UDP-N-acetylmuramoylalanine--D-glutamate ligase n=1 Tax=Virgibacillus indicus TaxID=2024554 RepID=A0A265NF16_9BACI|nr:UDP-N-acetylmuramoyl-L-alanine--D-glutamate ligase [Virgibacillus indicus]OZU90407.1 UDP-N-acetylmuramoyl-L-alanine--D-glutamate ligase [Virgibacillus indicus]